MNSNHVPNTIKVILSDEIKEVLSLYREAKPSELDLSFAPVKREAAEEGFAQKALAEMAEDGALAGLGGVVGAAKGILLGAAYAGFKVAKDYAVAWLSGDQKEIEFSNLNYLKQEKFPCNSFYKDLNNKLKDLTDLYSLLFLYQEQKDTRIEHWWYGRSETTIDDPKYLVAILLGRRLKAIANSTDRNKFIGEVNHLESFITKLCNSKHCDTIFYSRSNDTTRLSLRTIINSIRFKLLEWNIEETQAPSTIKLMFEELKRDAGRIEEDTNSCMDDVTKRLSYLLCGLSPDNFSRYNKQTDLTDKLQCNNEISNSDFLRKLNEWLFKNPDQSATVQSSKKTYRKSLKSTITSFAGFSDDDKQILRKGFSDYAGMKLPETAIPVLESIIEKRIKLTNMLNTFECLRELTRTAGSVALSKVMMSYKSLLEEIRVSQKTMNMEMINFVKQLTNYNNAHPTFKNNFTKWGLYLVKNCQELLLNSIELISKIFTLNYETAIDQDVKLISRKYNSDVKNIIGESKTLLVEDEQYNQSVDNYNEFMKSCILVDFKEERIHHVNDEIKSQPGFWDFITGNFKSQESEIAKLKKDFADEKVLLNETIENQKDALKLVSDANNENLNKLQEKETAYNKLDNRLNSLQQTQAKDLFANKLLAASCEFIDQYIRNTDKWSEFFHGAPGRKTAYRLKNVMNETIKYELKNGNIYPDKQAIVELFKITLFRSLNIMQGDFYHQSLRCYMLAFYDLLKDKNIGNIYNLGEALNQKHAVYKEYTKEEITSAYLVMCCDARKALRSLSPVIKVDSNKRNGLFSLSLADDQQVNEKKEEQYNGCGIRVSLNDI